jgi:hypothetical protein
VQCSRSRRIRGANSRTTQAIFKSADVVQVNIPAESGEMGVLANHVPSIEQLKPGLVEVIEEGGSSKQFFRMCCSTNLNKQGERHN